VTPEAGDVGRTAAVRAMLPASEAGIYLATHLAGPLVAESIAAVHASDELELRLGRVGPDRAADMLQRETEARGVLAAVMRIDPERVVLTHGVKEAVRLLLAEASGAGRAGESIVLVEGLDGAVAGCLADLAASSGLGLSWSAPDTPTLPAGARLVIAALVDGVGSVLETGALAQAASSAGAWLVVDASLAAGALDVDAPGLGAQAVVTAAHHWLLGPEEVAGLWVAPQLGAEVVSRLRRGVAPFARGTLLGLARSAGWLLMYAGLPWITQRTCALAANLRAALRAIDGVDVLGPPSATGPVVCFRVTGWAPAEAADALARRPGAILEADGEQGLLRASVGAWLRDEDVDRFAGCVAELARHTPETLPRHRPLVIVGERREGP
jgi:selenocysteine lyase/cysteine desulfurase